MTWNHRLDILHRIDLQYIGFSIFKNGKVDCTNFLCNIGSHCFNFKARSCSCCPILLSCRYYAGALRAICNRPRQSTEQCLLQWCKKVSDSAASKADLEAVCNCIKNALPSIENTSPTRISGLPKACGVNSNFAPVDPNYDCSK